MKSDLAELLRTKTLKSQIYKTIGSSKLGSATRLLKHSARKESRNMQYCSEGTDARSDFSSPQLKSKHSQKHLSKSINELYRPNNHPNHLSPQPARVQRTQYQHKQSQHSEKKKKKATSLLEPPTKRTHQHHATDPSSKNGKYMLENSQKQRKKGGSKSMSREKGSSRRQKLQLESIMERGSSEDQLITPENKKGNPQEGKSMSRTKKRERKESGSVGSIERGRLGEEVRRRIEHSLKSPQKFIRLWHWEGGAVSCRIIKGRIIEVEIFTEKATSSLSVSLEKNNIEAQTVEEVYRNTGPQTILALFSPVRSIDLDHPFALPRLHIQVQVDPEQPPLTKRVTIPYTWLHFLQDREGPSKKSRIRTKICLEGLYYNQRKLKTVGTKFQWNKRPGKGVTQFETHFFINDNEFELLIRETGQKLALQLQGKGEERLTQMVEVLAQLIS